MLSLLQSSAPILSPNGQFYLTISLFLVLVMCVGLAHALGQRRLDAIRVQFGMPVPIRENLLHELFAIMRHPHPWAQEMDALMDKAEEGLEEMSPEDAARMMVLIGERILSTDPDLRQNETRAATMALLVIPFVREEQKSVTELSGVRLVGSQAPENQTLGDAYARQDAPG